MKKFNRYLSVVFLGFWAMLAQILLLREFLAVFYGNELIFGVVIAAWLVGASLGAVSAGLLSARLKNEQPIFISAQIIGLAIIPLAIYLIRNIRQILQIPTGLLIAFVPTAAISFLITIPTTFMVGFCFPLASRLFKDIGRVYILEGLGAFLAGIVFSFLLAGRLDHFTIIFVTAILVVLNLGLLSRWPRGIIYLLILLLLAGSVFKPGLCLDRFSSARRLKSINPRMQLLESVDSKYQNITVARLADQVSLLSNGRFLFSFPEEHRQEMFINLLMAQHPEPKTILLIGSGIGGELAQILKYPLARLDYLELDPELIRVTRPYLTERDKAALDDERLSVFFSDGRRFVNQTKAKYDLIIVNVADAQTAMLNRFYTEEFFLECSSILKKNGTFTTGISSAVNYIGPDIEKYAGSIYQTLNTVFEYMVVMPGERNQFFCSSSPGVVTADAAVLEQRFSKQKIENVYFRPELFRDSFSASRVEFLRRSLEKTSAPLNTDSQPISYYYNLLLWNLFSGSRPINIFRKLVEIDLLKTILFGLGLFLLVSLAWMMKSPRRCQLRQQRFKAYWAVFTTGFAAMAFEIILIFSFQNLSGYVYEMLGLLIGMFMLGMIAGATISNNILIKLQNSALLLLGNQFLIVLLALILPCLRSFYLPLIFTAGLLTGIEFPLACRLYAHHQGSIGLTAGIIDSADLIGACTGVLLTATILVPLLGITRSCFVIAAFNLSSVILICFFALTTDKLGV